MNTNILKYLTIQLAIGSSVATASYTEARSASFGGYECTEDCSGHAAGYQWAEKHGITDSNDYPLGNSQSFHEGCLAFTGDPNRGSDEDDGGN